MKSALPIIHSSIACKNVKTLVDSGCQQSVVAADLLKSIGVNYGGRRTIVTMLDGNTTECLGEVRLCVTVDNDCVQISCLVSPTLVCDCRLILGIDRIKKLGGVYIDANGNAVFGKHSSRVVTAVASGGHITPMCQIDDSDFVAVYDGIKWTIRWKWKDGVQELSNQCAEYKIADNCKDDYNKEIEQWIADGWLEPHNEVVHGNVKGIIPLMAVFQPNKQRKVRPVMDYSRELNHYISSNPGVDVAICQEKLREWRRFGQNSCIVDLKKSLFTATCRPRTAKVSSCEIRWKALCYDSHGIWS